MRIPDTVASGKEEGPNTVLEELYAKQGTIKR